MKKIILTALPVLLCGCQSGTQLHTSVNHSYTHSMTQPTKPSLQMQQLWSEGALKADTPLPVSVIRADSDRVTLSWNGDAIELLRRLAHARGQIFSYAGVRLPLPVDIEVREVTYANLLRMIEMQTSWRATLTTYPGQMLLQFMPVLRAQQTHPVHGVKR